MGNLKNKIYLGEVSVNEQIKGVEYSIRRSDKTHGVRLKKALAKAILKQLKKLQKDGSGGR